MTPVVDQSPTAGTSYQADVPSHHGNTSLSTPVVAMSTAASPTAANTSSGTTYNGDEYDDNDDDSFMNMSGSFISSLLVGCNQISVFFSIGRNRFVCHQIAFVGEISRGFM